MREMEQELLWKKAKQIQKQTVMGEMKA